MRKPTLCRVPSNATAPCRPALLSELMCTSTNQQLEKASVAYEAMYDRKLWRDVASDTSGTYRQLLLKLLAGSRGSVDDFDAEAAAAELRASASQETLFFLPNPSESVFIETYSKFSQEQLAEIAATMGETALADMIAEQGFSDDFAELARNLQTPPIDLMVTQIRKRLEGGGMLSSLAGMVTADWRIIRTIGALPKGTVDEIAARYEEVTGVSLASKVEEVLGGDYRAAVLAWLAADPSVGMDDPAVAAMVDQGDKDNQPLETEPTEMFLKYDTDGTDSLSYRQIFSLIEGEGLYVPASLDWFDSDASGVFSQEEFGRLYAVMMHKKAKVEERLAAGLSAEEVVLEDIDPEVAAEEAEAAAAEAEDAEIDAQDEAMTLLDETVAVEAEAAPDCCCTVM